SPLAVRIGKLWNASETIPARAVLLDSEVPLAVRASLKLAPSASPADPSETSNNLLWRNTAQRIVHPLHQAALVERLATMTSLPTIMDELKRKFRLGTAPTLNEFVYQK